MAMPDNAFKRALRYGRAFLRWKAAGSPIRPPEAQDAALAICRACPHFKGASCRLCGCRLRAKIAMATESCPVGKW